MTRRVRRGGSTPTLEGPYAQGALDALCALYSAINAIAAVVAPHRALRGARATRLFRLGLDHVAEQLPLRRAVADGIEPELWFGLVVRLSAQAAVLLGFDITVERPFARGESYRFARVMRHVEAALDEGAVVLVSLAGAYDHYTVVRAHDPARLLLHDSCGLVALFKHACGSPRSGKRHRIDPRAIIVLRVGGTRAVRGHPP